MAVILADHDCADFAQFSVLDLATNAGSFALVSISSDPNFTDLNVFLYGCSHLFGDASVPASLAYGTVDDVGVAGIGLTVNGRNLLTGGTVTAGAGFAGDGFFASIGFQLAVTDLMAAARTVGQADDVALLQGQLAGNDMIFSGAGNDNVFGAGGADLIGGNAGNDLLAATEGTDILLGGQGRDTLDGGLGNDRLSGDAGADLFIFGRGYGTDRVTDLEDGTDRIAVVSGPRTLAELSLLQVGADVELRLGTATLVIETMALTKLGAADFSFARDVSVDALADFIDGWTFLG